MKSRSNIKAELLEGINNHNDIQEFWKTSKETIETAARDALGMEERHESFVVDADCEAATEENNRAYMSACCKKGRSGFDAKTRLCL